MGGGGGYNIENRIKFRGLGALVIVEDMSVSGQKLSYLGYPFGCSVGGFPLQYVSCSVFIVNDNLK